ncbi:TetR/AcrR family transcriptional regulator [Actinoplanes sp. NPDC020271]|uniref:TetR/AcrR family transcriptional regulator n=1 Tax=Actinoplanes sp. NPDC020271 TaxID=3363896 RepID=UPI0037B2E5BC
MAANNTGSPDTERPRPGRKRDHDRDEAILEAALDVLAEVGYAGMTMNAVAARARAGKATFYRRWPSKSELVLEAVAQLQRRQGGLVPADTGSLRGDLLALFRPTSPADAERQFAVMAGLASMLSQDLGLADAANNAIVEPWTEANRVLLRRAIGRGEVDPAADVDTLASVLPSMAAYRAIIQRKPFDREFLASIIDRVLLPATRR